MSIKINHELPIPEVLKNEYPLSNEQKSIKQQRDEEIRRIISECHDQAKKIILEHEDVLHKCASLLLEKEKVHRDEFEALFITENPETENNSI